MITELICRKDVAKSSAGYFPCEWTIVHTRFNSRRSNVCDIWNYTDYYDRRTALHKCIVKYKHGVSYANRNVN